MVAKLSNRGLFIKEHGVVKKSRTNGPLTFRGCDVNPTCEITITVRVVLCC